jgi:hypothetical protein
VSEAAASGTPEVAAGAPRVPVLTYHSHRISGETYESNDHEALRADLRTLHRHGFRVVPLTWVVEWLLGRRPDADLWRTVALSFDDGADFDFQDLDHPTCGRQRSFFNVLLDFRAEVGAAQPTLHATSFVIASPTVRRELDARCMVGRGWMSDAWWADAERSGVLAIHNHSWDHNHPMASRVCQRAQRAGSFTLIDTEPECDAEVVRAAEFIAEKISPSWPALFAYPGGESSAYLREVYFPGETGRHRTLAAFGGGSRYVERGSPRWNVPRLVCGGDWTSAAQFEEILRGAV